MDNSSKNQLEYYAATHANDTKKLAQNSFGAVFPSLTASLTVGSRGPVLLQDSFLIEKLQQGVRDKIVERNVHAKGAGEWNICVETSVDFLSKFSIVVKEHFLKQKIFRG